jgi:4-aminobutyrate aminotransferase-like enzyme
VKPSQPQNQQAVIKTAIPGPGSRALRAREDAHMAPGLQGYAVQAGIVVEEGKGSAVTDVDGNTYLDFIGGINVGALGHSHPTYVDAVKKQVEKISVGSFTSEARVELAERLAAKPPAPGVHRLQLYSGGAEAVESALRLAKCHTGKYELVSYWGGFHGKTQGALSLMGSTFKNKLGPMVPGAHQIPYADCYRCPVGLEYPSCGVACVEIGRRQVKTASAGAVAAVIVEPMQGTAGNIVPPKELMPAARALADELDAVLIADEMITGLGRTGKRWGVDHTGVRPDVVTIGKALASGVPIGAYGVTAEVAERILGDPDADLIDQGGVGGTLAGNALSMAAARATLAEVLTDEAFAHMVDLATAYTAGVDGILDSRRVPWCIVQLGARAEYRFCPDPPRTGGESAAAQDAGLDEYLHLSTVNRGILMTPFHNMALMCPETTRADVDLHTRVFAQAVDELFG